MESGDSTGMAPSVAMGMGKRNPSEPARECLREVAQQRSFLLHDFLRAKDNVGIMIRSNRLARLGK